MKRYRQHFIAGIAVCGVLISLLSFAPWVEFHSIDAEGVTPDAPKASVTANGTSLSRWRGAESLLETEVEEENGWCSCRVALGDGYLTASLGVLLVAAAAIAFIRRIDGPMALVSLAASVGTLGLAGYNGVAEWNAYVWTNLQNLEAAKGSIQPALYALIFVSALAAVASGLLWGAGAEMHEEMLEEEENSDSQSSYSVIGGARWA